MPDATTSNPTIEIDDPAALRDLVNDCVARANPLIDYGIAHAGLGHPPPPEHTRLSQRGGVIEHYERDLVLRAACGAPLGELQAVLRPCNQFLPIDADPDLTLGEIINHNVYGPLRVSFGAVRDLMLGARYVDGKGRDIHVGGRTVKNVAGYDVTRFMVGSLGEMGVVYEATLRTYAVPKQVTDLELTLDDPAVLDGALSDWLLTDAAPATMLLARDAGQWKMCLAYFGTASGCAAQRRSLETRLGQLDGLEPASARDDQLGAHLDDQAVRRSWRRSAPTVVRIIVPPAHTGETCKALADWAAGEPGFQIEALPIHGCIFAGGDLDAGRASTLDEIVAKAIEPLGGLRVWHSRPEGAASIEPFAPPQPDWPLLERLKRTMDPNRIFNPGRFLGRQELVS